VDGVEAGFSRRSPREGRPISDHAGFSPVATRQTRRGRAGQAEPLRNQADFRVLMMDVVFPTKPFAQ
jgi:hypothetical protein